MWIVKAEKGPALLWDYPDDYFPRKFYYKKDAKKFAIMVAKKGGKNVLVERTKENT